MYYRCIPSIPFASLLTPALRITYYMFAYYVLRVTYYMFASRNGTYATIYEGPSGKRNADYNYLTLLKRKLNKM